MHLAAGTRLGEYEIVEPLGRGGMGQVYRARDARLQRDVAIKIVHPELVDEESLARFRREAHVLASLCHPHIAGVHELDEVDGTSFIVMELVSGQTLAERLASGPIAVDEALRIASQIAGALEAVHERGVIHRDLKPANVKIADDGLVKVLDFGLARVGTANDAAGSAAATATVDATRVGAVLGSAAYMSPEQARGWEVDRRTDIWSFGCVLFEMIAARPAFAGASLADTTAAVIGGRPNWDALPSTTPPTVRRLLRRCLEPDPKRRLRDVGDARMEIEDAIHAVPETAGPATSSAISRSALAAVFLAGAIAGGLAGWGWWQRAAAPSPAMPARFAVPLPANAQLTGLDFPGIAFAHDGSRFAFVAQRGGRSQLFVRGIDALDATAVPDTFNAAAPFFSPDARWIGFFADGKLKKVPVDGGSPVTLTDAPVGLGGSWGADDTIVFASATGSGLSRVSANGGPAQPLTTLDVTRGEFSHRWPEWIADAGTVIFTVGTVGSWNDAEIVAQSLDTGERTLLVRGGTNPRYLSSGQLLYAHDGRILRVPFDATRREITGTAEPAIEDVRQTPDGAAQFAVSAAGHAVYIAGGNDTDQRRLVVVGRDGTATPLAGEGGAFAYPRVSPDGRLVVLTHDRPSPDLWTYDLTRAALSQLTFEARATTPAWTLDGRVTFSSAAGGAPNLFTIDVPPSGSAERLTRSPHAQIPGSWSPDGVLAYVERRPETGRDILAWERRTGTVRPLVISPADDSAPRFSPDGGWLAYVSNVSGRYEIHLRAASGEGVGTPVSTNGGSEPVWARDGRELYFRDGDRMMAVAVAGGLRAGPPRLLFEGQFTRGTLDAASYDVMPDGRFLLLQRREATPTVLHVLLNWRPDGAAPSGR